MKKILDLLFDGYIKLLFPLVVCIFLLEKLLKIINPAIVFVSDKLQISKLLGILDIFFVSVLVLIALGLLAGLLVKSRLIQYLTKWIENTLLRKLPFYNELKSAFGPSKNEIDEQNYRPVMVKDGDLFAVGYVTGKSEGFYTVVICSTNFQGGELRIVPENLVSFLNISFFDFLRQIRQHGADVAHFANENNFGGKLQTAQDKH